MLPVVSRCPVLITDLDGTILESMPLAWQYVAKTVQKRRKRPLTDYHRYLSSTHFYVEIFTRFWFGTLRLLPRMRRYMYLNDTLIQAYPGAVAALQRMQARGVITAIVTDNDEDFVMRCLTNNGLLSFEHIEIYSRERGTKLVALIKLLKKYRSHRIYFASHDLKDFYMLDAACILNWKSVTKIFTPNEIDKKDWFARTSSFAAIDSIIDDG